MRNKIAQTIIKNERKSSIIIDKSTTVSVKYAVSVLVICLRWCTLLDVYKVVFLFWDLVELYATTADVITDEILLNLNSNRMNED